jgi:NAD(P)-dependent dehydrogenase (short-subunit alcohol dehydrogenase family)
MSEERQLTLKDKTAIVTGAGRGIGKAVVTSYLGFGAKVLAADIDEKALVFLGDELESKIGAGMLDTIRVDVSSIKGIKQMVETCIRRFGSIDILVNNAGILHSTSIEDITEEEWDKIMAVNLKSMFFSSQAVLPYMKDKRWGRIINMSSLAGRMGGYKNGLAYSASKAGSIGLSQGMARRVAEYGITVNAIAPGTTESDIIKQFSEEAKRQLRDIIPVGRLGRTVDIADLATFLASDMAGFITGAVIDINGGMYMG